MDGCASSPLPPPPGFPAWAKRRRRRGMGRGAGSPPSMVIAAACFLVCLLCVPRSTVAIWPFPEKRFRYQGLIDAGTLGLNDVGSGIVAWGDWDGDQYLDAFVLSDDRKTLQLRRWDHAGFKFSTNPVFALSPASGDPIVNVVPADIDRDGHLDVLLMTRGRNSNDKLGMEVWLGRGRSGGGIDPVPRSVPPSALAQPMLLDATADMQMDLLGFPAGEGEMKMWENILETSSSSSETTTNASTAPAFKLSPPPLRSDDSRHSPCELADPHSSAYVDLNGDCMADLFLVCAPKGSEGRQEFQIWTATATATDVSGDDDKKGPSPPPFEGFTFSRSGYLPPLAGALSFADMNRDGTIDVVFTTCDLGSAECHVNVALNRQMGLCEKKASAAAGSVDSPVDWSAGWGPQAWSDWWNGAGAGGRENATQPSTTSSRCRRTEDLCVADDRFVLDFEDKSLLRIPLKELLPGHLPLLMDTLTADGSPHPIPLALGDFDKDGFPDVLLLSVPPGQPTDGSGKTSVHILRNTRCGALADSATRDLCRKSSVDGDEEGRWLVVETTATTALDRIDDARSASWVDVDEDGSLDVVLQRGRRGDRGVRSVTFVQNNYFYDAFFLKALTLNGACGGSVCSQQGDDTAATSPPYKPWGAALPGASYKFTVLDPNGNRRAQQVGQQYQSTYRSLLTPYSYFGLGRTNNYVETLFVGSTLHDQQRGYFISMEGVIPNSQVVISPSRNGAASWHRELYLQPGDWIPWVTVVLVTLIVALCGFVFAMHVNEKREDELERKRAVHAINFDALG